MKKLYYSISLLLCLIYTNAQVGIGTNNPMSTIDVRGSIQTAFREISTNTTLTNSDHYVTFVGTTASTITLPAIATGANNYAGRIYRIKNASTQNLTVVASNSNTIRATNVPVTSFIVPPASYVEVVNNTNTAASSAAWDLSYVAQPYNMNVNFYGTTLKIPNFSAAITNHSSTSFDSGSGTDQWWVISNTSTSYSISASSTTTTVPNYVRPSKMTIVYEYQGTAFDTNNLNPIITVGNSSSFPDVFTASFNGFSTVSGKTRLTITISRMDLIGAESSSNNSNWGGSAFFMNVLFTKKTY